MPPPYPPAAGCWLQALVTRLREELVQCRERAEGAERELGWLRARVEVERAEAAAAVAAAGARGRGNNGADTSGRPRSASRGGRDGAGGGLTATASLLYGADAVPRGGAKAAAHRPLSAARRPPDAFADSFAGPGGNGRGEWTPSPAFYDHQHARTQPSALRPSSAGAASARRKAADSTPSMASAVRGAYFADDLSDGRPFAVRKVPLRSPHGR
jgi:hypothetical protein